MIPWQRRCASKKFWALCREAFATGRHGQPASQGRLAMGLSSIRFACCRKHSKTRSTGCRMMPHGLSPLCCWNQCVFCAACRMVSLSKLAPLQRIRTRQRGVFEFWTRLRAFFTMLACTSIDQKDWFGFGECEQFVDQVFQWLHLRHSGQRAPIQFYIDAFQQYMRYISVSGQKPTER